MMFSVAVFASLIAFTSAFCQPTNMDRATKVFRAYDTDNNGKISRSEGHMTFRMSDQNSDGSLSPDEFSTEFTFYNSKTYMPFFNAGDENNDGKISFAEGNKAFDYFDNNEDGEISAYEFTRTWDYLDQYFNNNGNVQK